MKFRTRVTLVSGLMLLAGSCFANTPSINLSSWTLSIPVESEIAGKARNIKEDELTSGFEYSPYFVLNRDHSVTFRAPVSGPKTSQNTKYTRSELREMLRKGNNKIKTQGVTANNWVFSSAPEQDQLRAGGVDGTMLAKLAVNHVTSTGARNQVGRVIIGQIHANHAEPIRVYYRKLPHHQTGSIYLGHETVDRNEQWYEIVGTKSYRKEEPENGIPLDEVFAYRIEVEGNNLDFTLLREGQEPITQRIDMAESGYDQGGQYMYFKAGVYNQNSTGKADDFVQATFYSIDVQH